MSTYDAVIFSAWKHKAEEDWKTIQLLMAHEGPRDTICFHSQQLAEKYLKGFALFHRRPLKRIHQLDELLADCLEIDQGLQDMTDDVALLSEYYMPSRYPDDYPEEATLEEAEATFQAASRVRTRILAYVAKLEEPPPAAKLEAPPPASK
jgi:HEPN domain-containing protein